MKCIVHIGAPKTGTTSLQSYFNDPENLRDSKLLYPTTGRGFGAQFFSRHVGLLPRLYPVEHLPAQMMIHVGLKTREARLNYRKKFDEELECELASVDPDTTIVFSDEELFSFTTNEVCNQLYSILEKHFDSIEILAFLRSPVSYVSSAYSQSIRMGNTSNPKEFAEMLVSDTLYAKKLAIWSSAFGKECLRLEWYDGTDIIDRFTNRFDLKKPANAKRRRRNPSLSSTALQVLHHINKQGPHEHQLQLLLRNICEEIRGEKWTVSQELADYIVSSSQVELENLVDTYRFENTPSEEVRRAWSRIPRLSNTAAQGKNLEGTAIALFQEVHKQVKNKLVGYVPTFHPWIVRSRQYDKGDALSDLPLRSNTFT